jgi:hypothetical protein
MQFNLGCAARQWRAQPVRPYLIQKLIYSDLIVIRTTP